jgi:hypothetical protein
MSTIQTIKDAVTEARAESERAARRNYRFVWSRGTFITASDANHSTLLSEGDAYEFRSLADLKRVIEKFPTATELCIQGGHDGGETIRDRADGCYDPAVETWGVTVWQKDKGFGVFAAGEVL